jgi:hypothetical protein
MDPRGAAAAAGPTPGVAVALMLLCAFTAQVAAQGRSDSLSIRLSAVNRLAGYAVDH